VISPRIADLLRPFLGPEPLDSRQVEQISTYLNLLLKWNARMNLTAVRDPEQVLTRHFGESIFSARALFQDIAAAATLADVGSGAGFPGMPIALLRPNVRVTLIESHGKKATFLKEVIRTLSLSNVEVASVRAEDYPGLTDVVTFRAVERFASILPAAARIVAPSGRLAALVGESQVEEIRAFGPQNWVTQPPIYFPGSTHRMMWILHRAA